MADHLSIAKTLFNLGKGIGLKKKKRVTEESGKMEN